MADETEAEAVARLLANSLKVDTVPTPGGELLAVPNGDGLVKMVDPRSLTDEYLERPRRKKGRATIHDLESFIEYANRFKNDESVIFANANTPSLSVVFDYHQTTEEEAESLAGHKEHRATYIFPHSDEWKKWVEICGEWVSQEQLGEFLDERIVDVSDPSNLAGKAKSICELLGLSCASPNRLLELARGLTVHVGAQVKNVVNTGTGECTMHYSDEHTDEKGAPLKIPGIFLITIPVFDQGPAYQIAVRLRYRLNRGQVTWSLQLQQHQMMLNHAFGEACQAAATTTGLPLFKGAS